MQVKNARKTSDVIYECSLSGFSIYQSQANKNLSRKSNLLTQLNLGGELDKIIQKLYINFNSENSEPLLANFLFYFHSQLSRKSVFKSILSHFSQLPTHFRDHFKHEVYTLCTKINYFWVLKNVFLIQTPIFNQDNLSVSFMKAYHIKPSNAILGTGVVIR